MACASARTKLITFRIWTEIISVGFLGSERTENSDRTEAKKHQEIYAFLTHKGTDQLFEVSLYDGDLKE